jgi:DNA polymerase-1
VLGHQAGLWLPWSQLEEAQFACHLADSAAVLALKPRAARDIDPTAMAWERALEAAKAKQGWDYATVPDDFPLYWQYGAADTCLTSWLLDKHLPAARGQYAASYDLEMGYARLCTAMMSAGLMIDRPWIAHWTAEIERYLAEAMAWLAPWGIASPDNNGEIGRALERAGVTVERTRTGMAAVNKDAMERYQAEQPHAADLIGTVRYAKKAQSILSRCLHKFDRMAVGDVMHYAIHTIGAQRTSRSSITDPAMQTWDRDVKVIRGCFIPRPGYALISWDAEQIEMRLAAHFSRDPQLLADFAHCDATGESFFLDRVAPRIYGKITKADPRYSTTKNTAYSIIFGSGKARAAITAGVPIEQIEPVYEGWKQMYPVLDRWGRNLVRKCENGRGRPMVQTISGRHLTVDRARAYAAVDYTIQGSAADWMKHCALRMDAAGYGPALRLTQHDELIAEVPIGDAERVLAEGTRILTDTTSFSLPFPWAGKIMEGRWEK